MENKSKRGIGIKKNSAVWLSAIFLAGAFLPAIAAAQLSSPVSCCKLGKDIQWSGGWIYSGTVVNVATKENKSCSGSSPCKCSDKSAFPEGCLLKEKNTAGDIEICSQANAAGVKNALPDYKTNAWGLICLLSTANRIIDWIFIVLVIVVGLLIVIGAFFIATAGGSPDRVSRGRGYIIWALIGLLLALLSRALPPIVSALMGV